MLIKLFWLVFLTVLVLNSYLVDALICVNSAYCSSDADCIPGTLCTGKQISNGILTYSQCQDKSFNSSCIAPYATCGGMEKLIFLRFINIIVETFAISEIRYWSIISDKQGVLRRVVMCLLE